MNPEHRKHLIWQLTTAALPGVCHLAGTTSVLGHMPNDKTIAAATLNVAEAVLDEYIKRIEEKT